MQGIESLNSEQLKAALHMDGPLLIVAGAGAGKTKTITERIANLVRNGVAGGNILAVTFTNKAAKEMKERIHAALEREPARIIESPFVSTFHSLGVYILKNHGNVIGIPKHFAILDESDALSIVKEAIIESGLDPKQYEPRKIRGAISRYKGESMTAESLEAKASSYREEVLAKIWKSYEKRKHNEKALDFDDLLLKSVYILKKHPEVREYYQEKFKYVHVDEYQDTNQVQYELARLLCEKHNNICVVGDSDQTIYSWRGANIKNILRFEEDYRDATVVLLEENYRSTGTILEAANEVIRKNVIRKDKNLFTSKGQGEKITLYEAYDEGNEAKYIAKESAKLIESGVRPDEITVLYRANFQSRILEEAFLSENVPYQVLGVKFFDRKEIKDILCYLKAALNQDSLSDIKRIINIPTRGIGKTTIAKLFAGQRNELPAGMQKKIENFYNLLERIKVFSESNPPSEVIKYIVKESGIEDMLKAGGEEELERLENIQEMATLALKYDDGEFGEYTGLEKLLEDAALASDQDSLMKVTNAVKLMTVHASKGLEFEYVFICGLEHDLFPHSKPAMQSREEGEEERRLFYVAVTRARKKLYLTYASIRTIYGSRQVQAPSEFTYDVPEHLLEREYARNMEDKIVYIELD
jgi:DNA helicase II / ATP-dependent DNA helicase PcrA